VKSSRWWSLLLLLATLPALWLVGRFAWGEVSAIPSRLEALQGSTLTQREVDHLSWQEHVPALTETEALVRPVVEAGGLLETTFLFVAPNVDGRFPATRGATVLCSWLTPHAWAIGAPLDYMERLLGVAEPPGAELNELARAQFIVWAGVERSQLERLRALAHTKYGRDVLVPGWTDGKLLHVTLRFDVAEGLAARQPQFERFRPLFP